MLCPFSKTTILQPDQEIELSSQGASLRIFDSIEAAKTDWITAQPADNLFLHPAYLQFLEEHPSARYRICLSGSFMIKVVLQVLPIVNYCNFAQDAAFEWITQAYSKPLLRGKPISISFFAAMRC